MITIQIDGKTYKTDSEKPILIHDLYNTLELFGFEEVKENKEHPGTICEFGYTDTPYSLETLTPGQAKDFIEALTKEEPTVYTSTAIADIGKYGGLIIDWTPTPGQEIEVSNDGEKWEKRQLLGFEKFPVNKKMFLEGMEDKEYPKTKGENGFAFEFWKFARPIEDKIELAEETKKLMCDFADWYHNGLTNRERRSPEEELSKFLISK